MRREAMPIVAAGLWLSLTGLSRFPSQPTSSASLGNVKMRNTACAARMGPLLERYIRPFGEEGKRPGAHFVNLEFPPSERVAGNYQKIVTPQYARATNKAVVKSLASTSTVYLPAGHINVPREETSGTGRIVVVRQVCPGDHSLP